MLTKYRTRIAPKALCVALAAVGVLSASSGLQAATVSSSEHSRSWSKHHESVAERVRHLHSALRITADQETAWAAVANAMTENDRAMSALRDETKMARDGHRSAVEDLRTYEKFNRAHLDGLKTLIPAFEALYATMPDMQKALADQVFQHFGHTGDRAAK